MNDVNEIYAALTLNLGDNAAYTAYERGYRDDRQVLSLIFEEVEQTVCMPFSIYYGENCPPDLFCLPGFSPSPVVFTDRYIELSRLLRNIFSSPYSPTLRTVTAQNFALRTIAELALRSNPDYATATYAKALTGNKIWVFDAPEYMNPTPLAETGLTTRYYGLVHELGHLIPSGKNSLLGCDFLSKEMLAESVREIVKNSSWFTASEKQDAMHRHSSVKDSCLAISNLIEECAADSFATKVMLKVVTKVMERGGTQFSIHRFCMEVLMMLHVVTMLDICKGTVLAQENECSYPLEELACKPILMAVRLKVQAMLLDAEIKRASNEYLFKGRAEGWGDSIHNIFVSVNEPAGQLYGGFIAASVFYRNLHPNDFWKILDEFRMEKHALAFNAEALMLESKEFFNLANSFKKNDPILDLFKSILLNPEIPINSTLDGCMLFTIWIEDEAGECRPWGVFAESDFLVTVFRTKGPILDQFISRTQEVVLDDEVVITRTFFGPDERHIYETIKRQIRETVNVVFIILDGHVP